METQLGDPFLLWIGQGTETQYNWMIKSHRTFFEVWRGHFSTLGQMCPEKLGLSGVRMESRGLWRLRADSRSPKEHFSCDFNAHLCPKARRSAQYRHGFPFQWILSRVCARRVPIALGRLVCFPPIKPSSHVPAARRPPPQVHVCPESLRNAMRLQKNHTTTYDLSKIVAATGGEKKRA